MTFWTDQRLEDLHRYYGEGLSPAKIAQKFGQGVTRNRIIGKLYRLGLMKPGQTGDLMTAAAIVLRTERKERAIAEATPAQPSAGGVPFMALSSACCKFPVDISIRREATMEDRFCGAPVFKEGASYCADHQARCYWMPPKGWRPKPWKFGGSHA